MKNLKARIKHNNLEGYAGLYFVNEASQIIKTLKKRKKSFSRY